MTLLPIASRGIALLVIAGSSLTAQTAAPPDLPPAFPREGSTRVLDNTWGTAWEATWAPNKPTPMHRHPWDYVGVELADATFRVTQPGGQPRTSSQSKGNSWFLPRGVTHSEEGLSDPGRHAVVIDLKDTTSRVFPNTTSFPTAFPATGTSGATQRLDNARVVMWEYQVRADAPATMYFYDRNAFLVIVDAGTMITSTLDGRSTTRTVRSGEVLFRPGGTAWSDRAAGGTIRAIVVFLKPR